MALLKGPPGNTAGGGPFFRPTSPGTFYSTPNPQRMLPYSNLSSPTSPPFSLTLPSSETNFCIPILSRFLFPSNACPPPEEIRASVFLFPIRATHTAKNSGGSLHMPNRIPCALSQRAARRKMRVTKRQFALATNESAPKGCCFFSTGLPEWVRAAGRPFCHGVIHKRSWLYLPFSKTSNFPYPNGSPGILRAHGRPVDDK